MGYTADEISENHFNQIIPQGTKAKNIISQKKLDAPFKSLFLKISHHKRLRTYVLHVCLYPYCML